jgi:hypothetical protein
MRRRSVLAGVGALAAASGCIGVLGGDQMRVRVLRASTDRVANADAHCTLSPAFVENHAVLDRVLSSAVNAPTGEWVTVDTDPDTARDLASDLGAHCEKADGIYHYDDEAFVVRVQTAAGETVEHAA